MKTFKITKGKLNEIATKLQEMAYPASFNNEEFKSLTSFKERIQYCRERLKFLGGGSSRMVFQIDEDKVLKLAKNSKGLAQNEEEYSQGASYGGVVAEVFDADTQNYTWIEMQLARKAKQSDFKRILGISWKEFADIVLMIYYQYAPNYRSYAHRTPMSWDQFKEIMEKDGEEYGFLSQMNAYMTDYGLPPGDLIKISTYGVINKDGDDELVVIDAGLNDQIFDEYYKRSSKPSKYKW
jgi:hypothetical protein